MKKEEIVRRFSMLQVERSERKLSGNSRYCNGVVFLYIDSLKFRCMSFDAFTVGNVIQIQPQIFLGRFVLHHHLRQSPIHGNARDRSDFVLTSTQPCLKLEYTLLFLRHGSLTPAVQPNPLSRFGMLGKRGEIPPLPRNCDSRILPAHRRMNVSQTLSTAAIRRREGKRPAPRPSCIA
jgi:hypothetical protein